MNLKDFCEAHGIRFTERGKNSLYVEALAARAFVDACRTKEYRILGIEGFLIAKNETRPISSLVADFSEIENPLESCAEALIFLGCDEAREASHFEFMLAENCR
jgi:hypothetical protein